MLKSGLARFSICSNPTFNKHSKAFFYSPLSKINAAFFDKYLIKEENPDKINILEPNKALVIKQKRLQKKYDENPELVKSYDKVINIIQNELAEENDLSFIKLGKNGVPVINPCLYETLGVKHNANKKQIRSNFIKIALLFHPDKNEKTLGYFTHVCNAYDTLMDDQKRAIYDDETQNFDKSFYITIWKFKFNVIYIFLFSVTYFLSKFIYDKYNSMKVYYSCPLGVEKFKVDGLRNNEKNLEMLKIIEITKERLIKEKTMKIYEDDEYDYYIQEESSSD